MCLFSLTYHGKNISQLLFLCILLINDMDSILVPEISFFAITFNVTVEKQNYFISSLFNCNLELL